ncbi:Ribosome biogenesis protein NOP53 [Caenorhabditis elegans]|uniref:Ribosome biogenesis protein NOP53 n=1 Tax=Caenorhabditis elegans TaxID=6239 RepID=O44761_CAEEL|nr:Ribosome biogenesis protein NOP53 [Caenorhabditis elegans]CCD69782.1 Ribosome biogenesis protein NOP53 [Caenorhabditis elegans]|eukprot:NP_491210.1 Uncharacterized protein CELE_T12F5.1 [Caenorhabditis elegans]
MEEWKTSFREIYGRSPTAGDISVAPNHIKAILQSEKKENDEKIEEKQAKRGVKRKNFEMKMMEGEQFSPIKKRVNLNQLGSENDKNPIPLRSSPRKKMIAIEVLPEKSMVSPKKKPVGSVPFEFDDFSPVKSYSASTSKSAVKSTLTPIKSPTKRAYQRPLRDLKMLLLPTPEKGQEVEGPVEEFDDETNEDVAKARSYNPAARKLGGSSKSDQNFQKINLRKKQFVRGKVTAEQKRKLKRKQMFKKKY